MQYLVAAHTPPLLGKMVSYFLNNAVPLHQTQLTSSEVPEAVDIVDIILFYAPC